MCFSWLSIRCSCLWFRLEAKPMQKRMSFMKRKDRNNRVVGVGGGRGRRQELMTRDYCQRRHHKLANSNSTILHKLDDLDQHWMMGFLAIESMQIKLSGKRHTSVSEGTLCIWGLAWPYWFWRGTVIDDVHGEGSVASRPRAALANTVTNSCMWLFKIK